MMNDYCDREAGDTLFKGNTNRDIESAADNGSLKLVKETKLPKILLATSISLAIVILIGVAIYIGFYFGQKSNGSDKESPEFSHIHYVMKHGEHNRSQIIQGKHVKYWVVGSQSGDKDILSGPDKYGVFTISKPGFYEVAAQVVFHNMSPLNIVSVVIDGEDWISSPHSSPLQGNFPYAVTTLVTVSSKRCLSEGTRLTISLGYEGRRISALPKHTFLDIEKRS